MSLEGLVIHGQGISIHRRHINPLLTEICKTFSGENLYFMKSTFTRKGLQSKNNKLLTVPKINPKRFGLYLLVFVSVTCGISFSNSYWYK